MYYFLFKFLYIKQLFGIKFLEKYTMSVAVLSRQVYCSSVTVLKLTSLCAFIEEEEDSAIARLGQLCTVCRGKPSGVESDCLEVRQAILYTQGTTCRLL
jgi:hypothetical protein